MCWLKKSVTTVPAPEISCLIRAYEAGCRNIFEMAEFLDATEEYLREAIQCYRSKYGICVAVDNYIIYFEPFAVMKMIAVE